MSLPIWTPAALSSEFQPLETACWRLVEAQHQVSTMKLTDTLDEQALLEEIIEQSKPVLPADCQHLDYLLATPFRYDAVYPQGSRFRRAGRTLGVYYASEQPKTAVAEVAFYRLLFFAESPSTPWPTNALEFTAFSASISSHRALDLTLHPLSQDHHLWTNPTDYSACQAFADAARMACADMIRFRSVRDPSAGCNLAVLSCSVFADPKPTARQTWRMRLSNSGVRAICEFPKLALEFKRDAFAKDPRILDLNWDR